MRCHWFAKCLGTGWIVILTALPIQAQQTEINTAPDQRWITARSPVETTQDPGLIDDPAASASDLTVNSAAQLAAREAEIRAIVDAYLAELSAVELEAEACECDKKKDDHPAMKAQWNHGMELITEDKKFRIHVGGRVQVDTGWFGVDQAVQDSLVIPYGDGTDFRRARLRVDGTMYDQHEWAAEFDFVNSLRIANQPTRRGRFDESVVAPTDLWWTVKKLPILGNVRIGNQKEPIGFEHLVSSRFLPFMERSYNQDAFYGGLFNGFLPGVSAFNNYGDDQIGLWHIGIYKPTDNTFASSTGTGDYSVTGRLTRLLWYANDGEGLLHIGGSLRQATGIRVSGEPGRFQVFRTRDAIRTGLAGGWPIPAAIVLEGDDMQWANAELAMVHGPWTLQSEYLVSGYQDARRTLNDPVVGNVTYHGGYIQLLYFLTGEHDNYNKQTGVFERVTPHENFFAVADGCGRRSWGLGAWQTGLRYNYLDLNDEGLNGGQLYNLTYGLNWFWNPNAKWQFNYMYTYRDVSEVGEGNGSGWINGYGMRFAFDF